MPNPARNLSRILCVMLATQGVVTAAPATQPAQLPVKSVTLYTSGVGFFQHAGDVTGDGGVTLTFKTGQINDVIKSLVVTSDGGEIRGVQYPSQDPLEKTLKTFQIDLTQDPSLAELFKQLRGAKVTVELSGDKREGTVLGVEKRTVPGTPTSPAREAAVLTLFDGASVSQVELDQVRSIKLDDPTLQGELTRALAAVAAGRDEDKKPVTVLHSGGANQHLRLGYVVETPVWKTAYRLLMKDPSPADTTGDKKGKPATQQSEDRLQGWAVVENQTDADWNDVRLSLVSGRPISFVMNLYEPLYLERPTVELNLFKGLRPQLYQEGMQNHAFAGNRADKSSSLARARGIAGGGVAPAAAAPMEARYGLAADEPGVTANMNFFADGAMKSPAITAKLGTLFQYTIEHVSLPRRQSSLVPIVTDAVGVEAVSIYNETVLPRNPLTGAMVTNTTGKLLPQGPVTVYNSGGYAGDAQIEDLPAGEKRLLSFGVDLQTLVDVKADSVGKIVGAKIVKGVLLVSVRQSQAKTYAVQNKAERDATVIVEHPLYQGWDLVETSEPMEKTDQRYRFKLAVAKGKTETLKVTQQQVQEQRIEIIHDDVTALMMRSQQMELPQKVRDALAKVIEKRQALAELDRQSQEKAAAATAIGTEQQRLRENMKVVDKNGPYYTRLLNKLNEQESRIETLQKDKDDLDAKAKSAREELEKSLDGLNVE